MKLTDNFLIAKIDWVKLQTYINVTHFFLSSTNFIWLDNFLDDCKHPQTC